jgi:hypothetical protein
VFKDTGGRGGGAPRDSSAEPIERTIETSDVPVIALLAGDDDKRVELAPPSSKRKRCP